MHQLNMKLSVAILRDPEAERRAKEQAEAPTVKTQEQHKHDEAIKAKYGPDEVRRRKLPFAFQNVWRRKFRPLPEAKAVDLFADVIGDAFILGVAGGLIIYEYWKASKKPDLNKERIEELTLRLEEMQKREEELSKAEEGHRQRLEALEETLRIMKEHEEQRATHRLLSTLRTGS